MEKDFRRTFLPFVVAFLVDSKKKSNPGTINRKNKHTNRYDKAITFMLEDYKYLLHH